MKKTFNKIDNDCEQHAYNDHGNHRKIKPGIPFFYPYIAGQAAQPSGEEAGPEKQAREDDDSAGHHEKFAQLAHPSRMGAGCGQGKCHDRGVVFGRGELRASYAGRRLSCHGRAVPRLL